MMIYSDWKGVNTRCHKLINRKKNYLPLPHLIKISIKLIECGPTVEHQKFVQNFDRAALGMYRLGSCYRSPQDSLVLPFL